MNKVILISILIIFLGLKMIKNDNFKKLDNRQTKEVLQSPRTFKFVTAESGLNYREKPNGKVLGKFMWRDSVEYLYATGNTQKIIDNYSEVQGTWVAVKQEKDTVFVFDYYLSSSEPRFSKLKLYYAQPYYDETLKPSNKRDIRKAFVNVSESFYMPEFFLKKEDLRKDTVHLSEKQRRVFLERMNYSYRDSIFVYDLKSGIVSKFSVSKTPIMACIDIYSQKNEEYKTEDYNPYDYQIGFNLGKMNYSGFAMIGRENLFVEKGLQPIIFEETNLAKIESSSKKGLIPERWKNDTVHKLYTFNYLKTHFFVKRNKGYNDWNGLMIKDRRTKESFNINISEGESASKAPLSIKGKKSLYGDSLQYVGRLFKNKPPVVFGFIFESFSCPLIDFLDNKELPIVPLCDNRH